MRLQSSSVIATLALLRKFALQHDLIETWEDTFWDTRVSQKNHERLAFGTDPYWCQAVGMGCVPLQLGNLRYLRYEPLEEIANH